VIFSDEKKFNLDGPDGLNSYWRDLRKEPRYFSRRNYGGGSVMVWGAFSALGKLELRFVSKSMDGREYQEVLSRSLLPFLRRYHRLQVVFQQDNAGIHRSKRPRRNDPDFVPMMRWFEDHGVDVLEWPSRSPDLNPIENLWGIIVCRIYDYNRQYQTVDELKEAILQAWNSIPEEIIQNLVDSMQNRVFQVINRSGHVTDY
jgi:transposase